MSRSLTRDANSARCTTKRLATRITCEPSRVKSAAFLPIGRHHSCAVAGRRHRKAVEPPSSEPFGQQASRRACRPINLRAARRRLRCRRNAGLGARELPATRKSAYRVQVTIRAKFPTSVGAAALALVKAALVLSRAASVRHPKGIGFGKNIQAIARSTVQALRWFRTARA
jgi:hypothetical protein